MLKPLLLSMLCFLLPAKAYTDVIALPTVIPLKILDHPFSVEVAYTPAARSRGLMYRSELEENSGMLFIFPQAGIYGMWMLNTPIPLSVAFLDDQGIILNFADMVPFSTIPHYSAKPAKYALEMNLGWFAKQAIRVGHRVQGLEAAPEAE